MYDTFKFCGVWVNRQADGINTLSQLLLLPHSLFPCVHGMLWYRSREEERMMYSYLEKGLGPGPSLLVERLLELICAVKNKRH